MSTAKLDATLAELAATVATYAVETKGLRDLSHHEFEGDGGTIAAANRFLEQRINVRTARENLMEEFRLAAHRLIDHGYPDDTPTPVPPDVFALFQREAAQSDAATATFAQEPATGGDVRLSAGVDKP